MPGGPTKNRTDRNTKKCEHPDCGLWTTPVGYTKHYAKHTKKKRRTSQQPNPLSDSNTDPESSEEAGNPASSSELLVQVLGQVKGQSAAHSPQIYVKLAADESGSYDLKDLQDQVQRSQELRLFNEASLWIKIGPVYLACKDSESLNNNLREALTRKPNGIPVFYVQPLGPVPQSTTTGPKKRPHTAMVGECQHKRPLDRCRQPPHASQFYGCRGPVIVANSATLELLPWQLLGCEVLSNLSAAC